MNILTLVGISALLMASHFISYSTGYIRAIRQEKEKAMRAKERRKQDQATGTPVYAELHREFYGND